MNDELLYLIALSSIHGLGPVKAKALIQHTGSAQEVFRLKHSMLRTIPEIGRVTAEAISRADFKRAEKECQFIAQEGIRVAAWSDSQYPERLKHCDDSPLLIYARGNFDWNPARAISIVGTRKADFYGKHFCEMLIAGLTQYQPTIISGLAHGIDGAAHMAAVEQGKKGGIVSEFMSHSEIAPEMFPMRNRIIAGMADCTIVVQTDIKGGSMITAHIAHSYGRDVFAVPGRWSDGLSKGCHQLIKNNMAAILSSAEDLVHYLQWDKPTHSKQTTLVFSEHPNKQAQCIIEALRTAHDLVFDDLMGITQHDWGTLNSLLLQLEFEGVIKLMPGKRYRLIGS